MKERELECRWGKKTLFLIFFDFVNEFVWYSEVLDCVSTDVAFGHFPEAIGVLGVKEKQTIEYW